MQGGPQGADSTTAVQFERSPAGFTLLELLVVVGIIALLIAILMPALSGARRAAQRTACAAKLHQMLIAAELHQMTHHGYYPLVGELPGASPAELEDDYSTRYDYLAAGNAFPVVPTPMPFSLARDMHYYVGGNADVASLNAQNMEALGFSRNFLCPSQAGTMGDLIQLPWSYTSFDSDGNIYQFAVAGSYIYNEAVCGWGFDSHRLHGKASLVRQPAATMFVCDGLMGDPMDGHFGPLSGGGSPGGQALATLYNTDGVAAPVTMADALVGDGNSNDKAGDSANFDMLRHRGKINIGYCDGHVETRDISVKSLTSVYLLAP
jgi:prepilin-type processing-associated H-X9-DG protein/prepilin-type N-terminal cleavage/methylation domain-containing protein